MKRVTFFSILALHFLAGLTLYETKETPTTRTLPPEDTLLKSATYDNAQFAIYALGGEAAVDRKIYKVAGYGHLNALGDTEIVDTVNWRDYIAIGQSGVTRYSFGDKRGAFTK